MSAFSFTAPVISDEKQEEEYNAFTDNEKKAIEDDMMGNEESFLAEEDISLPQAIALLEEALAALPEEETRDYLHAKEVVPELVEQETHPLVLLRLAKYDAWLAAQRRVRYWKLRKELFGVERAFLPLTSLPNGALNEEDRRVLQLGFIAALPGDRAGRRVFYMDRIRITRGVAERGTFLRVFFYVTHTLMHREECQMKGIVALANFRGFDMYKHVDRIMSKKLVAIRDAIGLGWKSHHFVIGSGRSVFGLLLPALKFIYGKEARHRLVVHSGSDKEIVSGLARYGVLESSIPTTFGGSWSPWHDFESWLSEQRKLEEERTS